MFNNPGNKYAEKWTAEAVLECLGRIEQEAHKENTNYLGMALMRLRISRRSWSYWRKKFIYDEEIMEHIDLIDGIFETKLAEGGLDGTLKTAAAIFCLKHNYGWKDQPHNEQPQTMLPGHRGPALSIELTNNRVLKVPYPELPVAAD
jgi:hypothetical protein